MQCSKWIYQSLASQHFLGHLSHANCTCTHSCACAVVAHRSFMWIMEIRLDCRYQIYEFYGEGNLTHMLQVSKVTIIILKMKIFLAKMGKRSTISTHPI